MKFVFALLIVLFLAGVSFGQYYYSPNLPAYPAYVPAPVYVTPPVYYYTPPVYYAMPYYPRYPSYYEPRVYVHPKVYVEGQPVRNLWRAVTP